MNINKLLWEYKSFFITSPLMRMLGFFIALVVMNEIIIPIIESIFVRYVLGIFTILFAFAFVINEFFESEILKKPKDTEKEVCLK